MLTLSQRKCLFSCCDELERELEVLIAMKMTDKRSLPKEIKDHLDEGGLFFLERRIYKLC